METWHDNLDLDQVSAGVFEKAVENIVFLRAQTGAGMSRLSFAAESMATQESNMRSALGRIEDVDIAEEAANWPSTRYLCRHLQLWLLRQTQPAR